MKDEYAYSFVFDDPFSMIKFYDICTCKHMLGATRRFQTLTAKFTFSAVSSVYMGEINLFKPKNNLAFNYAFGLVCFGPTYFHMKMKKK